MGLFSLIFGLLAVLMVLTAFARRVSVPMPVVLVIGGLALSLVPGLSAVRMPPELVLLVFLPPLLFSDAFQISWRDFRARLRSIALLAVGLVAVTAVAVAALAHGLLPELSWPAAFVLGAVVAPTDAVAALAIAHRAPIDRATVTVVTGEALLNDATALVAYKLAIAATLTGVFHPSELVGRLLFVGVAGLAIGWIVGRGVLAVHRLTVRDVQVDNMLFLLAPFVAYLPAEAVGASGVLAVVMAGLVMGRGVSRLSTPRARLQGEALWDMITYLLNGMLFVLIGLQLRGILHEALNHSLLTVAEVGLAVTAAVIATRVVGTFAIAYLPRWLSARVRRRDPAPAARDVLVLSWTGMRGGVSLAAALAIPTTLANGAPFPGRDEIVAITFVVILGTLVFQGLTLQLLIRWLGVRDRGEHLAEEERARLIATEAALSRLDELATDGDVPEDVVETIRRRYRERLAVLRNRHAAEQTPGQDGQTAAFRRVQNEAVDAQRMTILMLRDQNEIGDDVLAHLQHELDLEQARLESTHHPGDET